MFEISAFLKYIAVGFAVAAPVGPMSLLCIDRTVRHGPLAGIAFGCGIAAADISYALIVGFGVAGISSWLENYGDRLRIVGAVAIIVMASLMFRKQSADTPQQVIPNGHWRAGLLAYLLTMSNPQTILLFAAVFTATSFTLTASHALLFAAGVGIGSYTWWVILAFVTHRLTHRLAPTTVQRANQIIAVCLIIVALYLLGSTLQ